MNAPETWSEPFRPQGQRSASRGDSLQPAAAHRARAPSLAASAHARSNSFEVERPMHPTSPRRRAPCWREMAAREAALLDAAFSTVSTSAFTNARALHELNDHPAWTTSKACVLTVAVRGPSDPSARKLSSASAAGADCSTWNKPWAGRGRRQTRVVTRCCFRGPDCSRFGAGAKTELLLSARLQDAAARGIQKCCRDLVVRLPFSTPAFATRDASRPDPPLAILTGPLAACSHALTRDSARNCTGTRVRPRGPDDQANHGIDIRLSTRRAATTATVP